MWDPCPKRDSKEILQALTQSLVPLYISSTAAVVRPAWGEVQSPSQQEVDGPSTGLQNPAVGKRRSGGTQKHCPNPTTCWPRQWIPGCLHSQGKINFKPNTMHLPGRHHGNRLCTSMLCGPYLDVATSASTKSKSQRLCAGKQDRAHTLVCSSHPYVPGNVTC